MWYGAVKDEVVVNDGLRNGCDDWWKPIGLFGKFVGKLKGCKSCLVLPTLVSRPLRLVYHVLGFEFSVLCCHSRCLEKRVLCFVPFFMDFLYVSYLFLSF